MLTAYDLSSNRYQPLLGGCELAASAEIELLQQALLALSQVGLPIANPGTIDGVVNKQTIIALLSVFTRLDIGMVLKAQLLALAYQAASVLGSDVMGRLDESGLYGAGDDAMASLTSAIETAAPTLTTAVRNLTQKISGQTPTPTSPASISLRDRLLANRPTMTTQAYTPPVHTPGTIGPGAQGYVAPGTGVSSKTKTYALIGVGVVALGAVGWWLLR
jgi:hypothetical protein